MVCPVESLSAESLILFTVDHIMGIVPLLRNVLLPPLDMTPIQSTSTQPRASSHLLISANLLIRICSQELSRYLDQQASDSSSDR
jgi:hypothetical protein